MVALPTGTITFLFTDIQGSTKLWEAHPDAMRLALARHDALLRQAIEDNNGYVFKTVGDAFCAAFHTAPDALRAALAAQQALHAEIWPESLLLKVRMAIHTGAAEVRDNDYFGQPLNRVARLLSAGHGGQTLLSDVASDLGADNLPAGVTLLDLGTHTLRDLGRRENLFQLLHPTLPADFPPLKTLNTFPNNLPPQLTSFIGREKEIEESKRLLAKTRLLTLTGSGGSGKTRLALQLAAEVLEEYADGVWLVELAALSEPGLLASTIALALGIREQPGQTVQQTLLDTLKGNQQLLILDNCEHLLSACAQLVTALLRSCPQVRVLATSREALGIGGEQTYRVPSLTSPDPKQTATPASLSQFEAVRLFIDRACFHKPDFAVSNANAPSLAQLCHRLDGIPLAIELAAARVRALPVEGINTRLDNRFRLLTGGDRAALPRQQTLRALIDWSYDLLTTQEKLLLGRLCVFAGGWTLEAAEQIGSGESASGEEIEDWEVLDLLTSLVDKSLVPAEERGGSARYRMLETVRQYGWDRLVESGENETVRDRHRDYFLALAEAAEPQLTGADQGKWLDRLAAEHENLRAGLDWSLPDRGPAEALRYCGALQRYWWTRGYYSEGRKWCEAALETAEGKKRSPGRAKALNGAGNFALLQNDYATARDYHEKSLTIRRELGDRNGIAGSLMGLGNVASRQGEYAAARAYIEESLALSRELGERIGIANSLNNLGQLASAQGDYAAGRAYYIESLAIRREIGDRNGIATALNNLGNMAADLGDKASGRAYYAESLAIFRELGDRSGIAHSLSNLGNVAADLGDFASGRAYYEESLVIRRELGDRNGITASLTNLGTVAMDQGDYGAAVAYHAESLAISREIEDRSGIAHSLVNLGNVAYFRGDYAAAQAHYTETLAIRQELGDRIGIATALNNLGTVSSIQGDYAVARASLAESLAIRREIGEQNGIATTLTAFAGHAAREGRSEQAATLWAAAEALRRQLGIPPSPNGQEAYDREVARVRQALGEEAFSAAWAAGTAMTIEQAIDETLYVTDTPRERP